MTKIALLINDIREYHIMYKYNYQLCYLLLSRARYRCPLPNQAGKYNRYPQELSTELTTLQLPGDSLFLLISSGDSNHLFISYCCSGKYRGTFVSGHNISRNWIVFMTFCRAGKMKIPVFFLFSCKLSWARVMTI